jgi:hypothetical protein
MVSGIVAEQSSMVRIIFSLEYSITPFEFEIELN